MWNMIWPILIVVGANTVYNVSAKSTPSNVNYPCKHASSRTCPVHNSLKRVFSLLHYTPFFIIVNTYLLFFNRNSQKIYTR